LDQEVSDYLYIADSVFEILLTITTILTGSYSAIALGWFTQAVGQKSTPEVVTQATIGIILALIFIVPLVFILFVWALSKFRKSLLLKTVAWSGLTYILTQDFLGVVAMFVLALIFLELIDDFIVFIGIPFILIVPPILGALIGYRVCRGYTQVLTSDQNRIKYMAILTVISLTILQSVIGLIYVLFS
jgi:hypothetical protein